MIEDNSPKQEQLEFSIRIVGDPDEFNDYLKHNTGHIGFVVKKNGTVFLGAGHSPEETWKRAGVSREEIMFYGRIITHQTRQERSLEDYHYTGPQEIVDRVKQTIVAYYESQGVKWVDRKNYIPYD